MSNATVTRLRKDVARSKGPEEGAVVRFKRHFAPEVAAQRDIPEAITYAAIFVGGFWYYTGRGNLGRTRSTHNDFVDMLASASISDVEVATVFEEV